MTTFLGQCDGTTSRLRRGIALAIAGLFAAISVSSSFAVEVYPITNGSNPSSGSTYTANPSGRYDLVMRDGSASEDAPAMSWSGGVEPAVVEAPQETWSYEGEAVPGEYPGSCPSCYPSTGPWQCGPNPPTWMNEWGCGGSPYHTGPGRCDNWRVGPIWDVVVDGAVLFREDADLDAIETVTNFNSQGDPISPLIREQFDYAAGGRLYLTGLLPKCAGYQVQFGYVGVEDWNAELIYPKETIIPDEGLEFDETRAVYLRSTLHSAEINFMRNSKETWRPYWGVRYFQIDDDIRDRIDQDGLLPLAGPGADPIGLILEDMTSTIDIKNHLIGPQIGLRHDLWNYNYWLFLQGFANAGVYYNKTKRTDSMRIFTTIDIADDTDTPGSEAFGSFTSNRTDTTSELSHIAYAAEASLTMVCKLNQCLALRGGYQILWIDGIHMAEDAFLDVNNVPGAVFDTRSTVFQGWHAGIEYKR